MKKIILAIATLIMSCGIVSANDLINKSVKLGCMENGESKLTFDESKLKVALNILVKEENMEIGESSIIYDNGSYYLWNSLVNKSNNQTVGKLVISIEKNSNNEFFITSAPIYVLQCLAVNGSCVTCQVKNSNCYCEVSPTPSGGTCEWKKVKVDGGSAHLYDQAFLELLKSQG